MASYGHAVVWSEEQHEMEVFGFINFGQRKKLSINLEEFGV